uniref:Uncharacterized protein n=1 Tax=Anopheles dirus TaxID=7168 RepID=A0A182NXZ9_9DIPT
MKKRSETKLTTNKNKTNVSECYKKSITFNGQRPMGEPIKSSRKRTKSNTNTIPKTKTRHNNNDKHLIPVGARSAPSKMETRTHDEEKKNDAAKEARGEANFCQLQT